MWPIFKAQWQNLRRNPIAVLIMTALTVVMSFMLGFQATTVIAVKVLPSPALSQEATAAWLELLNRSGTFEFTLGEEAEVISDLSSEANGLALRIGRDDWSVVAAAQDPNAPLLAGYVGTAFRREATLRALAEASSGADLDELRAAVDEAMAEPALRVTATEVEAEEAFEYDPRVHTLLGMGLFFATFTIMFGVNNILEERRLGVWDRVIYSPATRLSMYAGHLSFTFLLGFLQVAIIFALFRFVFGVPLGQNAIGVVVVIAAYTFAIVALGLLLAGLVRTSQQMAVVIPIVAVSSAMLGGAYWPLEIVSSQVLLTIANFVPITYAMDALKGIAYYSYGFDQLLWPLAVLVLFGVVCMGVGLRLVERRG